MSIAYDEFHLFGSLPPEIRLYIWLLCLPCRTIEIGYSSYDLDGPLDIPCSTYDKATEENCQPPLLLRVCRESRRIAKSNGHEVKFHDWATWVQPRLDRFLLLHPRRPDPFRRYGFEFTLPARHDVRLERFFGWAQQHRLVPCIYHILIMPFSYPPNGSNSPWLLGEMHTTEVALVAESARCVHLPVSMKFITLHVTREQAAQSGLFGLFAENTVQLVDAYDQQKLSMYYHFCLEQSWNEQEDIRKGFERVIADDLPNKLDQWVDEARWTMVASLWLKARSRGFSVMDNPQGVWIPRVPADSVPVYKTNFTNGEHPWVQHTKSTLPILQPKIEFWVCWRTSCLESLGVCTSQPQTPPTAFTVPEDAPFRPGSYDWYNQQTRKRLRERREGLALENK